MINPVSGPSGAKTTTITTDGQSSGQPADNRSTIHYGRKKSFPFLRFVEKHLSEIWNWIKYNLFFCVFDAEEEKEEDLKKQLEKYVGVYFDKAAVPSKARALKLKKAYEKLDSEIKDEIKSAIAEVLKEAKPSLSTQRLNALVKETIDRPFSTITDKTKPPEQQKIHVMGKAILQVVNKLAGYTKE